VHTSPMRTSLPQQPSNTEATVTGEDAGGNEGDVHVISP